jgi:flagellin-like protein
MFNTQSRSQVGIGTLIVFIAMVLVAAIASGVLIQTAGLLQSQAQQTGDETTSEVSDLVQIDTIIGYEANNKFTKAQIRNLSNTGNNTISHLNVSVSLASGSNPVNVSDASYAIETANNATFVNGNPNSQPGLQFYQKQGLEDDATILSDQSDVMIIGFNLTNISGISPLEENGRVKFILNSPAGAQSTTEATTPSKIEENKQYIL